MWHIVVQGWVLGSAYRIVHIHGVRALKGVSHFISNPQQKAKHMLVAERVMHAPSKEKEHTLDIDESHIFFEICELHALLLQIMATYCTHMVR